MSVHRGVPGPEGVLGLGGCLVWGPWSRGGCAWSGGVPGPGCLLRGVPGLGGVPALGVSGLERPGGDPLMATAVGGTHPTGMHSCLTCYYSFTSHNSD